MIFVQSTSAVPCQYHPTNIPYSYSIHIPQTRNNFSNCKTSLSLCAYRDNFYGHPVTRGMHSAQHCDTKDVMLYGFKVGTDVGFKWGQAEIRSLRTRVWVLDSFRFLNALIAEL
jgi:hypothetical protein